MGFKVGGTLGKITEKVKENAPVVAQTAADIMLPGGQNTVEALQGKKTTKEAIFDTAQDLLLPGSRRTVGSVSGSGKPFNPGDPVHTPNPALNPRNEWQGMRRDAIAGYQQRSLGYNPYMTQTGPKLGGMNYDPYRQAAVNQAQSQASNQFASHQSGLLSGSDRMKAFSDFNRAKIQGTLGANQQFDQAQSQNQMDVGKFNTNRQFDVNQANTMAQNQANQYGAMAKQNRDFNLYQDGLNHRNLNRQLEASQIIGQAQMNSNYKPGVVEKMLNPIWDGFDAIGRRF